MTSSDAPNHSPSPTDFGREKADRAGAITLATALRDRVQRLSRTEVMRFHVGMGLVGFVGGLVVVVPVVLWLKAGPVGATAGLTSPSPKGVANAVEASAAPKPVLIKAPVRADREAVSDVPAAERAPGRDLPVRKPAMEAHAALEGVRGLIRAGDIVGARTRLSRPELASTPEGAFMLAETYDPNVLAALGIAGVAAETDTARRHYETALEMGVAAAGKRLEALE